MTEAPAISTRPGLPTYPAWTVGGRSQRGPLLSCGPNALYQGAGITEGVLFRPGCGMGEPSASALSGLRLA
jgi:hypothetical protein